jgi:4-amino-4-deoxy-L-arabinose transferase-like glycosyltransferase
VSVAAFARALPRQALHSWTWTLHYATLAALILLGAYLRLTGLRTQSLWFDEVDVVVRAQRPLDEVLRTFIQAGENGAIYNIFLALWIRLAGISEIAVRFPSAVAGVLTIPVLYLLARRVIDPTVGLFAAGLLAISPYHLWYSQEAKMYAILVLLATGSSLLLVEALERGRWPWWAGYVAVTSLMFYTHVASVLVFVAQALYIACTWRRWAKQRKALLISGALLTLPYLPIALWALRVVGGEVATWQPDVGLWDALRILGIKFAANRIEPEIERNAALLFLALAVTGLGWLLWRRQRERWWLFLSALAAIPVVGLYLVSLRNSVFSDRYAIVALPAYLTLVAVGLVFLVRGRLWPVGMIALLFVASYAWAPIRDVNRSQAAEKEDWRSAYAYVAANAQPGDTIIVHPGYIITTFDYYAQRESRLRQYPVATIPSFKVLWLDRPLMIQMIGEQLGAPARIWLIQSPDRAPGEDPDAVLETWLAETGTLLDEQMLNGVVIQLYEMRDGE